MRRNDRAITDVVEILSILNDCKVLRLAMVDENVPYIVPLNFGYTYENSVLEFYFHCANEGKKLDIIRNNPNVCFEMDCSHELTTAPQACGYGYNFRSVIGNGRAEIVDDINEKKLALSKLMKHQSGKDFEFSDSEANTVTVFKVVTGSFTAKARG